MELFILAFILVLALAALLGWTADSRDGADWRPSEVGLPGQRVISRGAAHHEN